MWLIFDGVYSELERDPLDSYGLLVGLQNGAVAWKNNLSVFQV